MKGSDMDYRDIGRALRSAREAHHLQQADVARILGITPSGISRIESGSVASPIPRLKDYAAAVGLTLNVSIEGADSEADEVAERVRELLPALPLDVKRSLLALVELWETQHLSHARAKIG
jgi:transcriptional regulator with XRE-family HTH domain